MKVCDILAKQGCVEDEVIEKALKIQANSHKKLEEILLEMGAVKESDINEALVFQSHLAADRFSDKVSFLEHIEPFDALKTSEIEKISLSMEWKEFTEGELIIREGTRGDAFYIVKNGLAKIYLEKDGTEKIIGFLGEGDFCGATALLSDGINPSNVSAIEPVLCLMQDEKAFADMIASYPQFGVFFNKLIIRQSKKIFTKLLTTGMGTVSQVEPFLYSRIVKDLISPKQVFCTGSDTIEEAARKLIDNSVNAAVVLDDNGRLMGVISLKRLAEAAILKSKDPHSQIEPIIERDFNLINAEGFFFDALHEMMKKRTDTLVVMTGETVEGVLTSVDLLKFRGREVLSLIRNIEDAQSFRELNSLREDVENVLRTLITDGALASHACKIVSELNDRMVRRVIRLCEEKTGKAPAAFAWLGLGSEGRKEQSLLTDQDNAILFDDPPGEDDLPGIEEYFRILSERIVNGLNECGFPLCKGNIMATNPRYFGSLSAWKKKTSDWINIYAEQGKDIIDIYTFLDFRAIYGSESLEEALKSHVIYEFRENPAPLRALAQPIVSVPIPIGFFKHFIVEKNGKYKNTVNIKTNGLLPLTTCIKLLSLKRQIKQTNTLERIRGLVKEEMISDEKAESLEQAFETFLTLKIYNNLNNLDQGRDFSNNVNPSLLGTKQKQLLKDAFLAVSELQKFTKEHLGVVD